MRKLIALFCASVGLSVWGAVVPGVWNTDFTAVKEYSDKNHIPMVVFMGSTQCDHCQTLIETVFASSTFKKWQSERQLAMAYCESTDSFSSREFRAQAVYKWFKAAGDLSGIPMIGVYWPKSADSVVTSTFLARNGTMPVTKGSLTEQTIESIELTVGPYGKYSGGQFVVGSTKDDRLEVQFGETTFVDIPMKREDSAVAFGATNTLEYTIGGSATKVKVVWNPGEAMKMVRVPTPAAALKVGDAIALKLLDGASSVVATSTIAVVERETNPKNPLWFGERTASTLQAGEWTADRDLALACASSASGSTLTLIGGSLWCPDCVNADAYLVDTAPFRTWAAVNGIFCAAIDVSAFPKNGKTCLLTYDSTTVSDRYVNATVPPQERVQSGAGYLSRKMIPQTGNGGINATAIWARNLNLATNSVVNGGLCRPECLDVANTDTGAWKTGVPCFIMQNAAGRITGRLYQFSNVSPTDASSVAAYVQRLEELRQLADDPTEELNKHWLTATTKDCELALRGGSVSSTVSAIDTSEFWCLSGRDHWTRASFKVKGSTGATGEKNARLVLWRKSGDTAEKIASVEGNLAAGFTLSGQEIAANAGTGYFIQLETIAESEAFKLEHVGSSVVTYTLTSTAVDDAGTVAFSRSGDTVTETEAKLLGGTVRVYAPLARTGGASGSKTATVTVDESLTSAFPDRYRLVSDTVTWSDGDFAAKSVAIDVFDDDNADGTQALVLKAGTSTYTLLIEDDDTPNVGRLSISSSVPAMAKKSTVIAEEGSVVKVGVSRIGGASGLVGCVLGTTAGAFEDSPVLAWDSRESGDRIVALRLPALDSVKGGKVTVSFAELSGIQADASTKNLTVQMVAAGAPRFETDDRSYALVRYCSMSDGIAVQGLSAGAVAKVKKVSGTIPSGIKVSMDGSVLRVAGTPTKAGLFEAVYQVSESVAGMTTAGLTVRLGFAVVDVSALDPSVPGANPSVAKSRSFGNQPVVDSKIRRLTGLLTGLTVPPTGKCSAKYKCSAGTVSLSTKGWELYDEMTGTLTAYLTDRSGLYQLTVNAIADGTVLIAMDDPELTGAFESEVDQGWSAYAPATAWKGYYTAAVDSPDSALSSGGVLAAGNPYLTLKMQTDSAAKKGSMSYAGVLPNGQSFSGSATLVRDGLDTVLLPVYYSKGKELFSLAPQIAAGAPAKAVVCGSEILPWWTHTENAATYEVCYTRIAGSWYDKDLSLLETLNPTAKGHQLTAGESIFPLEVLITDKSPSFRDPDQAKAISAKLSFKKATGLVSGSFKVLNSSGNTVTATYKGVILPDWGDGCPNCGELPWASGSFWYSDALLYSEGDSVRSLNVKVGGVLYVESY